MSSMVSLMCCLCATAIWCLLKCRMENKKIECYILLRMIHFCFACSTKSAVLLTSRRNFAIYVDLDRIKENDLNHS